jgi:hypothetical protein
MRKGTFLTCPLCLFEEESQSGQAIREGARSQSLVAQHVELKLANLLGAQLIGLGVEVRGEIPNRADIAADRGWRIRPDGFLSGCMRPWTV